MTMRAWIQRHLLRVVGLVSVGAALLAMAADEILQYTPQGYATLAFTHNLPLWRMFTGHLLGVLAIPLCITGYWCVCQALKLGGARYTRVLFWLMAYGLVMGAITHDSLSIYFELIRAGGSTSAAASNYIEAYANVPGAVFMVCYVVSSMWYTFSIASGGKPYPIWMCFCSPFIFTLLILLFHSLNVLPVVMNVLWPAWLSTAHVIFFALSTLMLWNVEMPERHPGNFRQLQEIAQ